MSPEFLLFRVLLQRCNLLGDGVVHPSKESQCSYEMLLVLLSRSIDIVSFNNLLCSGNLTNLQKTDLKRCFI